MFPLANFWNPILYESAPNHPVYAFPTLFPLALAGLAIGFMAGMFGVGGGFMLTPVLNILFGVPMPLAIGSSLCQQCGTTFSSFLKYRRFHLGEPRIGLYMIGGALLGTNIGTNLLKYLKDLGPLEIGQPPYPPAATVFLEIAYIFLLSTTIAITLKEALATLKHLPPHSDKTIPGPLAKIPLPPYVDLPGVHLTRVSLPILCFVGLFVGILSGLMGIGGGVAFVPILIYGYGLSIRNTAGSSLLLLFAIVISGTIQQAHHGFVSLPLAMAILIGSSLGAQLGAMTTYKLPNHKLRWFFLGLLTLTVAMIVADLYKNLS